MKKGFFVIFILICPGLQAQISGIINAWQKDPLLKSSSFGVSVLDAKTSEIVYDYNSRQSLIPASTLKLVTTAAAIHLLGPGYKFETRLFCAGTFDKASGILRGDLIILGSGDPTLQSENFYKDAIPVTDTWAKALKDLGIKEITGKIIGDAGHFPHDIPNNWIWEDICNYYGAAPCALSYRDNKFTAFYESKEEGSPASIKNFSPLYLSHSYNISSNVIAKGSGDEAYGYGDPFSFSREIKGTIPANRSNYEVELTLPDPALLCAENLYLSLQKVGIQCREGSAVSDYTLKNSETKGQLLYTHYSPSLEKIIYFTNQKSNNLYCESLLRAIGKGSAEKGLNLVKKHWANRGLDTTELYMEDASGLSRINSLTTRFASQLLCKVYRDSLMYRIIDNSLPVSGRQGSMNSIGKGSFIENNLRAKTGYITRVRAYAGFVKSKSGKELAFSVIINNYNGSAREAKLRLEKFLIALGEL